MKCPNLRDYTHNASTNVGNDPQMIGVVRGDIDNQAMAAFWPKAAIKDYQTRKPSGLVLTAGKDKESPRVTIKKKTIAERSNS